MAMKKVQCYAHGSHGSWEAMCVDLDISVQGQSFEEVRALLNEALHSYVQDACAEDRRTAERLLRRRAPVGVRVKLAAAFLVNAIFDRKDEECRAGFDLACPA